MEPESRVKTLNVNQNKIIKNLQPPDPPPQKIYISMFGKMKKRYTFLFNILRILNAIVILDIVVEIDKMIQMV